MILSPLTRLLLPMYAEPEGGAGGGGGDPTPEQPDPVKLAADLESARAEARAAKEAAATAVAEAARIKAEREAEALKAREKDGDILNLYEETKGALTAKEQALAATAAELAELKAEKQARLDAMTAANTERLGKLPEEYRALVPAGLDPETTATQIARVEEVARKATAQPEGGRGGPRTGKETPPEKIPAECIAEAQRYGMEPAIWFETVYKPRMKRLGKPINV